MLPEERMRVALQNIPLPESSSLDSPMGATVGGSSSSSSLEFAADTALSLAFGKRPLDGELPHLYV